MDRKDWNRIGLAAAVLLVPGGFLLGATMLARRATKVAPEGPEPPIDGAKNTPASEPSPPTAVD
ncbi:MAG: hypothetical protein K2X59_01985 [Sphingomonas sp.]|nr:hypothetical protein [Sphingomonas sp.]